jgi:Leucine-rich repeat (LRR) protein
MAKSNLLEINLSDNILQSLTGIERMSELRKLNVSCNKVCVQSRALSKKV